MEAGGIASNTLNEIEDALSLRLVLRICKKKKETTSNNGMPLNPGKIMILLFRIMNFTRKEVMIFRFILVSKCILKACLLSVSNPACPVHPGTF